MEVNSCSRTSLISDAQQDLLVLGAGYVPTQNAWNLDNIGENDNSFPFIAGIEAAIAGIVAYLTLRRSRKGK